MNNEMAEAMAAMASGPLAGTVESAVSVDSVASSMDLPVLHARRVLLVVTACFLSARLPTKPSMLYA